jgi:hypothetical protein
MTDQKKLEVIEEAFNYYHDRTSLTRLEEKELTDFVDELKEAISVTRCSTQLPTEDEILSESNSRQLEGAEPYSFAGGARWALSNIKQIPKTQKED